MFCKFRQSKLQFPINWVVAIISLLPVLVWLHFAFVQKGFLSQFVAGQTLLVDLFLGLPVVLVFAIVIYAMMAWSLKLLIMLFMPQWILPIACDDEENEDENYVHAETERELSDASATKEIKDSRAGAEASILDEKKDKGADEKLM